MPGVCDTEDRDRRPSATDQLHQSCVDSVFPASGLLGVARERIAERLLSDDGNSLRADILKAREDSTELRRVLAKAFDVEIAKNPKGPKIVVCEDTDTTIHIILPPRNGYAFPARWC